MCDTDARHFSFIEIDIVSLDRPIYFVVSLVEVYFFLTMLSHKHDDIAPYS